MDAASHKNMIHSIHRMALCYILHCQHGVSCAARRRAVSRMLKATSTREQG